MSSAAEIAALMQQVSLSFETEASGQERAEWTVRWVHMEERISEPYRLKVQLGTRSSQVRAGAMRGKSASVTLERGQKKRVIHGIVTEVLPGHGEAGVRTAELTIEPALSLLQYVSCSRVFSNSSVPDIAKLVLEKGLLPFRRKVKLDLDSTSFQKRECVVQHQESDLAFALRLLAEEGIWFYFRQPDADGEPEEMVLTTANAKAPKIASSAMVRLSLDKDPIAHEEAITRFDAREVTTSTALLLREANWTHPEVPEKAEQEIKDSSGLVLPVSDYGDIHAIDFQAKQFSKFDTKHQAQVRLEALRAEQNTILGESNALLLRAGHQIEVEGRPYLVTAVEPEANSHADSATAHFAVYANQFSCVPLSIPFRPARKPKPRIAGHEYATVVDGSGKVSAPASGTEGSDIAIDPHKQGRVRVKFDWDETEAGQGGTTSGWLHAIQPWAGAGWGVQMIPRVGMRVVISFEGGDPDRPVILGCTYSGLNPAPFGEKPTRSGVRTQSSISPGHYNELSFDDTKGHEEFFTRAERDRVAEVLNDDTTTVNGKQTQLVKKSQGETVHGDATLSVGGKRTKTVGGDKEHGEEISIKGERKTTVSKKHTEIFQDEHEVTVTKAAKENYLAGHERTVTETQKLEAKADKLEHVVGSYQLTTDKAYVLNQGGTKVTLEGDKVSLDAAGPISVKRGPATIDIDDGGNMAFKTTGTISFEVGPNKVVISMSGVELQSPTGVSAKVAPSELALTPASASLKSVNTTVEATAVCAIKGTAMVGLNS